ncbi:YlaN family protein [Vagococcus salmoninarum]|uniref:Uncharacterized protein n=1 Tax=Vagococcus salmoninarum TaxID=2739 RepID=A0A429ZT98_9ENTE|nr:YlaN family protein [Vagococcus salmoninarum]MBE9389792.1 YlaN family protein [Vagococcus salmoninarum]RST96884.1 hypothetical protein CBF35_04750 [Vagococcus salmoninarum]
MDTEISKEFALDVLDEEAKKIRRLISNQRNHLCIAQCKAFEEVVDTQMYGFSRQVDYAVRLGIITTHEGHKILAELEQELNKVYNDVYEEQKESHVE